jgi:hypothetical protein
MNRKNSNGWLSRYGGKYRVFPKKVRVKKCVCSRNWDFCAQTHLSTGPGAIPGESGSELTETKSYRLAPTRIPQGTIGTGIRWCHMYIIHLYIERQSHSARPMVRPGPCVTWPYRPREPGLISGPQMVGAKAGGSHTCTATSLPNPLHTPEPAFRQPSECGWFH